MRLHEIQVEMLSSFLLNKYAVHDFLLLPVMLQVQQLSCIIPTHSKYQSLDKHNF